MSDGEGSERVKDFSSGPYKEMNIGETFKKDFKDICKRFETYTFDKDLKTIQSNVWRDEKRFVIYLIP